MKELSKLDVIVLSLSLESNHCNMDSAFICLLYALRALPLALQSEHTPIIDSNEAPDFNDATRDASDSSILMLNPLLAFILLVSLLVILLVSLPYFCPFCFLLVKLLKLFANLVANAI